MAALFQSSASTGFYCPVSGTASVRIAYQFDHMREPGPDFLNANGAFNYADGDCPEERPDRGRVRDGSMITIPAERP
jgi:hypothetical protein